MGTYRCLPAPTRSPTTAVDRRRANEPKEAKRGESREPTCARRPRRTSSSARTHALPPSPCTHPASSSSTALMHLTRQRTSISVPHRAPRGVQSPRRLRRLAASCSFSCFLRPAWLSVVCARAPSHPIFLPQARRVLPPPPPRLPPHVSRTLQPHPSRAVRADSTLPAPASPATSSPSRRTNVSSPSQRKSRRRLSRPNAHFRLAG